MSRLSRRRVLAGLGAAALVGCERVILAEELEFLARRGEVMLEIVEGQSLKRAYDVGPALDQIEVTSVTTYTYQGTLFTSADLQRTDLRLRHRERGGLRYVTVPELYPNSFRTIPGSTKRYPSEAYRRDKLLGREDPKPGKPLGHSTRRLSVPIDPDGVTVVLLEEYRVSILEATPSLIRYRLAPRGTDILTDRFIWER